MTDVIDQAALREEQIRQQAINAALSKPLESQDIDESGNYYCNDCGIQIPFKRIAAVPHAVCCIDCQTIREYKGKHFV